MTAPTLPTTLSRLAELLPRRVRIDPHREASYAEVRVRGEWQYVYYITPDSPAWASHGLGEMWLEAALREECEAREWLWRVFVLPNEQGYGGEIERGILGRTYLEYADTPAHALALAVEAALAALEGGG